MRPEFARSLSVTPASSDNEVGEGGAEGFGQMYSMGKLIVADVFVFLGVLFAIVALGLLTRAINIQNLLMAKHGPRRISPERVQLLIFTLAAALNYLNDVVHIVAQNHEKLGKLPEVSNTWLVLLGGSHATYLGGKTFSVIRGKSKRKAKT